METLRWFILFTVMLLLVNCCRNERHQILPGKRQLHPLVSIIFHTSDFCFARVRRLWLGWQFWLVPQIYIMHVQSIVIGMWRWGSIEGWGDSTVGKDKHELVFFYKDTKTLKGESWPVNMREWNEFYSRSRSIMLQQPREGKALAKPISLEL